MLIGATYIKAETVTKRKNLTGDGESEEKFPWTWQMGRQIKNSPFSTLNAFLDTSFNGRLDGVVFSFTLLSPKNGAVLLSKIQSYFWAKSGSLIRANTVQLSRADLDPRAHWVKWAPVWDGIPTAFYWGHFRLNCAQTAQAPGEVESYNGPAVLNWPFVAETDFYLFQH